MAFGSLQDKFTCLFPPVGMNNDSISSSCNSEPTGRAFSGTSSSENHLVPSQTLWITRTVLFSPHPQRACQPSESSRNWNSVPVLDVFLDSTRVTMACRNDLHHSRNAFSRLWLISDCFPKIYYWKCQISMAYSPPHPAPKEVGVCTCVSPKVILQMCGKIWAWCALAHTVTGVNPPS